MIMIHHTEQKYVTHIAYDLKKLQRGVYEYCGWNTCVVFAMYIFRGLAVTWLPCKPSGFYQMLMIKVLAWSASPGIPWIMSMYSWKMLAT